MATTAPRILSGLWGKITLSGLLLLLGSCGILPKNEADAQSRRPGSDLNQPTAVDVAIAQTGTLRSDLEYTGTTQPFQEVSLRSQAEGRLLNLTVDVGDSVTQGQTLAQLDDALLVTAANQARAELAARKSDVARAQAQVANVRTQVEEARLQLQQAQADAARLQGLGREGAIAAQTAEQAQTAAKTAQQALNSTQAQLATEQEAIAAAQARVAAQQAILRQAQERLSYTLLASPISGVVLERMTQTGNLIQPGSEVLKLGDFSRIKVIVQISDLVLGQIRVGQSTQVRLDAFPNQSFDGKISRISPVADPTSRLIPVEVTIPNRSGTVGSGLLARVSFVAPVNQRVIVPQVALQMPERASGKASDKALEKTPKQESRQNRRQDNNANLFVIAGEGKAAKAVVREVILGDRADGKVEILSGLQPGEQFIARSAKPLKSGEPVRLSILSEPSQSKTPAQSKPGTIEKPQQGRP
ncbi:MAG: efflux RND transporter periplasmic adaptor subunit [Leptolyngbyaceae bacterium]|nr:efflux RND transporter periplasmic adaptor subunit [Leptolyngbyaceae bacterium]